MTDRTISRLQAKISKAERALYEAGLRELVTSPQGRAYLWHVLGLTGLFTNPHRSNALDTAFACGAQNIGQMLLAELDSVAPDAYLLMMRESLDNDRSNASRLARAAIDGDPDPADDDE